MAITARTTVIVSFFQVGVIVLGVLAVATSQEVANAFGHPEVFSADLLMNAALVLLVLPFLWICVSARVNNRAQASDDTRRSIFVSGLVLLALLVCVLGYATVRPWAMAQRANVEAEFEVRGYEFQLLSPAAALDRSRPAAVV